MEPRAAPWLVQDPPDLPVEISAEHGHALAMFRAAARRAPGSTPPYCSGTALTVAEVDAMSDALACALAEEIEAGGLAVPGLADRTVTGEAGA